MQLVAGFDWCGPGATDGQRQQANEAENEGRRDDLIEYLKGFSVMCTSAITALSTECYNTRSSGMSSVAAVVPQVLSRYWRVAGNAATITDMKRTSLQQSAPANEAISYSGSRFPLDVISYAVWLYYRFPLSLRMLEELLAARGIGFTYETVRLWSVKYGLGIVRHIRASALARGDKWHLEEVVVTIHGKKHWMRPDG